VLLEPEELVGATVAREGDQAAVLGHSAADVKTEVDLVGEDPRTGEGRDAKGTQDGGALRFDTPGEGDWVLVIGDR
jgi:hypothetical protein